MKTTTNNGGIYQLKDDVIKSLEKSKYFNEDLAPTLPSRRNWTAYNIAACWVGMNVCIPAYQMASSAVSMGLKWWLAILLVLIGNCIVLVPILLNANVGTKYGIPFPVYARESFGMRGAQIPSVLRSVIGIGWTGILIWQGAEALQVAFSLIIPSWEKFAGGQWVMFLFFWALNIGITYAGSNVLKKFESLATPALIVALVVLIYWDFKMIQSGGYTMNQALNSIVISEDVDIAETIIACLVANIAFYSTWALNIPDLTRYCKDQKSQIKGQLLGMPISMVAIALVGVITTGVSALIFGEAMWDPNQIVEAIGSPGAAIFSAIIISLATLTTNVTTNILPPVNGICNLYPNKITYKRSVVIVGILVIIMQPWKLVSDPSGYIYNWLGTYGSLTGPVASILIFDYYLIKKKRMAIDELYKERESRYWYRNGFNWRAIAAWGLAIVLPILGKFVDLFYVFSLYGWIVSFLLGFVFYALFKLGECKKEGTITKEEEEAVVENIRS